MKSHLYLAHAASAKYLQVLLWCRLFSEATEKSPESAQEQIKEWLENNQD